jgi:DNA-binding NtrC family response regulator/predicted hydrocarbon binding protein
MSLSAGRVWPAQNGPQAGEDTPTLQDLTERLTFSPGDGRIWMNDQRMVLMRNTTLGVLRKELIASLGLPKTRSMLTRIGYVSGKRDAELVQEQWSGSDPMAMFLAGTRLHALEGMVKVEPIHLQFDAKKGTYSGEFVWHNSCEVEEHIAAYGIGSESACWTLTGYAIGYVSTLLGKLIIFRETECRATGCKVCRVIGKPADEWDDVEEDLRSLNAEGFVSTSAFGIPTPTPPVAADLPVPDPAAGLGKNHMIGVSSAFNAACHMLRQVAPTQATVLFTGESGVGKEMFAAMLHDISRRQGKPFISVNCAAIPDTLMESELFGVDKGAFTGATVSRPGRFERANGGTLFLDEIGTMSLVSQGKLLRALQEGVIERVGGTAPTPVDVRLVAATNEDLLEEVKQGRFRDDLYYRLNVYPIHLPSLRERRDDIPLLLSYFLRRYNQRHGRNVAGFLPRTVRMLLNYAYPGNIRELQNMVERGVISVEDGGLIDIAHIFRDERIPADALYSVGAHGELFSNNKTDVEPSDSNGQAFPYLDLLQAKGTGATLTLDALEQKVIEAAVEHAGGNLAAAARILGLSRAQLAYRLQK